MLTKRQQEALAWVEKVGKASEKLVRTSGFSLRTMEALVKAGLIEGHDMPRFTMPFTTFRVFRAKKKD